MLSRRDIEKELGRGINIVPLKRENIKENSINISVSSYAWTTGSGRIRYTSTGGVTLVDDNNNSSNTKVYTKGKRCTIVLGPRNSQKEYVVLLPRCATIIETLEVVGVDSYIGGALHSKVGIVAKAIGDTGTMLGPGFCGHLMVSLHNITDDVIILPVGSTFASLSFDYLTTQVIRTSATTSGHVDKFAPLGIKATEAEQEFLEQDWKSNLEGIRDQMKKTLEYKEYCQILKDKHWDEVRKYFNKRNIIACIIVLIVFAVLLGLAFWLDSRAANPVWVERYLGYGCSGLIGSLLISLYKFLKGKK